MRWTEQSLSLPLQPLSALAESAPELDTVRRGIEPDSGLLIAVGAIALETVTRHLAAREDEQGGLLLGEVYAEGNEVARARAVRITQSVPSQDFASTGVSLRMESGVWEQARRRLGARELIVGWYHSHPGLGAFFSHTDRRTQRAFFAHAYSVAWVVDPLRAESAWFVGPDSVPPARVVHGAAASADAGSD